MADRNVRYGAEIRKRAAKVYGMKTSKYECPACSKVAVKRMSYSKWECNSCKNIFAGGAFSFTTPSGQVSKRVVEG